MSPPGVASTGGGKHMRQRHFRRLRVLFPAVFLLASAGVVAAVTHASGKTTSHIGAVAVGKAVGTATPVLARDVKTGKDTLGSQIPATPHPIQDYVQPDTQIEPSIAVNPANPQNAVAAYQEGRIADGG